MLGWSLDALDYFILVFCVSAIATQFSARVSAVAEAIFVTLAMRPVGAFLFGLFADRYGRRRAVLAGLGILKGAPNRPAAEALIEYLTRPAVQAVYLREVSFYPVLESALPTDLPAYVRYEADGVVKQSKAPDAKVALLPIGLGSKGGDLGLQDLAGFQQFHQAVAVQQ